MQILKLNAINRGRR